MNSIYCDKRNSLEISSFSFRHIIVVLRTPGGVGIKGTELVNSMTNEAVTFTSVK